MGRVVRGLVALAVVAGTLTACASSASLKPSDVEQQIAQGLTEQAGGDFTVACPSEVPAEAGYAFTCDVTDRTGGGTLTVAVVEDDATGAFSWKVAPTAAASGAAQ